MHGYARIKSHARFEVVTAVNMTITVLWVVTPYGFIDRPIDVSEGPAASLIWVEEGGASIYLLNNTLSHTRRQLSDF
jgi:hypothetical protein